MKKTILLLFACLIMAIGLVSAASITRTISGSTVTLTIHGDATKFGGIIAETLPTGYSTIGITSQMVGAEGSVSGKVTGQLYEIALAASTNPATISYGVSGSGSGSITGTFQVAGGGTVTTTGDSSLTSGCTGTLTWSPDASTVCAGTSFTQSCTSSGTCVCPASRSATGTKSCGCTSNFQCGAWSNTTGSCGTRTCTDLNGCASATTETKDCFTTCQFYETNKNGSCEINTTLILLLFGGLIAIRMLMR
jgi:hypothetical protein